jgi:hypothetical protein
VADSPIKRPECDRPRGTEAALTGTEASAAANVAASNVEPLGTSAHVEEVYGVYAPRRRKRVLHSDFVEFRTDQLPRRKPRITGDDSVLAYVPDGSPGLSSK